MLSEETRRNALVHLPQTWYEQRLLELNKEFQSRKEALERQRSDADFDSNIIRRILMEENMEETFRSIKTNEQMGESLYFWIKQIGRSTVHFALCEIIFRYKEVFRDEKYMSENEISHIANFFIDTMPYSFRFSELIYFMNKGSSGGWGKMFGLQMTSSIFFEWFQKYLEELAIQKENEHITRKDITRPVPEKIEDLFKSKFQKWDGQHKNKPREVADEKFFNRFKNDEG